MFDKLDKATGRAFNRMDAVRGESSDPDVQLYNTLTKDDFVGISNEYGAEQTLDYINTMERKRLRRK